ncbi:hypothetical protein BOTBODRAFT_388696 [Botryobasidium botryosum FD-172 SS1]|uniref:Uncharacterized protein n=1 Tax=Botryobasidium botryosum (strain FD-172 SS1) TaxID=930990 RepID=A0A067MX13_BOTB1|nr:hypothetical protein BOTBODRAFT_388696 [Botryobasidium botryosum FD-172 SS1]
MQEVTISQHAQPAAVAQTIESPAATKLTNPVAVVHITRENQLHNFAQPVSSEVALDTTTVITSPSHEPTTPPSQPIAVIDKARRDSSTPILKVTKTPTARECIKAQKRAREARALQAEECRRARAAEQEAHQARERQAEERRATEQERQRLVAQKEENERRVEQERERERQVEQEKAAAEKARTEQADEDDAFLKQFYEQFIAAVDVAGPITLKRIELETKGREQALLAQGKFGVAPRECRRLQFAAWSDSTPAPRALTPAEGHASALVDPTAPSPASSESRESRASFCFTPVPPAGPAPDQSLPFVDHASVTVGAPLPPSTLPQGFAPVSGDAIAAQERAFVEEGCCLLEQMASQASQIAWDEMVVLEAWRRKRAHQAQQAFGISPRAFLASQFPNWSSTSLVPEGEDEWVRHMLALSAAHDKVCAPMPASCPPAFVSTTTADSSNVKYNLAQCASCGVAPMVPSADDVPALSYPDCQ